MKSRWILCGWIVLFVVTLVNQSNAADAKPVLLGSPELTAGIPGTGPLTTGQIKTWLANPANHKALEVELPQGLAVGKSAISIPADNPLTRAKIELGRQLYLDKRLSADNTISCASCHDPAQGYSAHTPTGVGIRGQTGNRNSPVCYNRILSSAQFWDGRAASLEAQAVGPIQNPIEMGNTHEAATAAIKKIEGYQLQFAAIFPDGATIDNIGRAIAAFERAVVTSPSPADYYEPLRAFEQAFPDDVKDLKTFEKEDPEQFAKYKELKAASDAHPINESAKRGREIFFGQQGGCTACHVGANFTDEKYHNLGVGMAVAQPDLGRFEITKDPKDKGAFKTPTVRNVADSAPYMHDGSQKTLEEVVEWYDKGGHPNPNLSVNVKKLNLTATQKADLVAYMKSLTGSFPVIATNRLPQ
jgi:cytochrome c peroxidase